MKPLKANRKLAGFKEQLDFLRRKTLTDKEFNETYRYFFDTLGDNQKFIDISKPIKRPKLKKILHQVGKEVIKGTGGPCHITKFMLLKVPYYPFVHGSFFLDQCVSSLFFFEDINTGMAAILLPSMETHFTRISYTTEREAQSATVH